MPGRRVGCSVGRAAPGAGQERTFPARDGATTPKSGRSGSGKNSRGSYGNHPEPFLIVLTGRGLAIPALPWPKRPDSRDARSAPIAQDPAANLRIGTIPMARGPRRRAGVHRRRKAFNGADLTAFLLWRVHISTLWLLSVIVRVPAARLIPSWPPWGTHGPDLILKCASGPCASRGRDRRG